MNLFVRLKEGLSKTRSQITSILSGDGEFDEQFFDSLEDALIAADIGIEYTGICGPSQKRVETKTGGKQFPGVFGS